MNEGAPELNVIAKEGYYAKYYLQLEKLLAKGTPIDKIGFQNHIFYAVELDEGEQPSDELIASYSNRMNPEDYFKSLDYLSDFGLPLEITECTIPTPGDDEEAELIQADLLETFYTIWFSIPKMETIVYWNSVDRTGYSRNGWNENNCRGGLFHRDLTPKKSAERLYYLLNEKWHTELDLTTDENGRVDFRGFYGSYEIEIDGEIKTFDVLKNDNNDVVITL